MSTVAEALALLQRSKAAAASSLRQAKAAALAQLSQAQHRLSPRHTPSGPRRRNEGIEDEDQGIVAAEASADGATVTVSLLAAGFVVGPGGASVRAICAATGADVRSYTESQDRRRVRVFVISGKPKQSAHALQLIAAAVEKYVQLTGGAFFNQQVEREQVIGGVSFIYSPPPRAAVPYAAALRTVQESPTVPPKTATSFFSPRTAAGKENSSRGSAAATPMLAAPAAQAAPLQDSLLATPTASVQPRHSLPGLAAPLPPFAPLSRTSSWAAPMDEDAVATPAYTTAPAASYSLFAGLGAGTALFGGGQAEPFGSGGSVFSSAFETPSAPTAGGTSLFSTPSASDATPDIASLSARQLRFGSGPFEAQLPRAGSCGDDALLAAAAGVPAFPGTFRSQGAASAFPPSAPALPWQPQPQPQQSALMAAGPLGLLPLGTAAGPAGPTPWASASGHSIWGPPF